MKLPKRFKLGAHTIEVEINEDIMYEKGAMGDADISFNKIRLSLLRNGKERPETTNLQTFYHEKIHHILYALGKKELNNDESFVDAFANLMI